jgi:hypothetical protein
MISPRFSNVNYGADIRYNIPETDNLGSPDFPLTFQGSVKENYDVAAAASLNNFAANAQEGLFRTSPAQGQSDLSEGGPMSQIINYDRLIFANQKSRLYGLGDPIRGDLAITPIKTDWFRPSVHPNIDLRQGAINVISGHDNSTANELRALQSTYSGKTALAQKDVALGAEQADIIVTAFP